MTIAQHDPAPARQQRFIELYNVGSETVPAYGVCEVVGSSRPEAGGTYTPDGGPTVLHVRLAEISNPCNHVVNGHCDIPVYERKKVGTKDSPMLALVASDYPPGTAVGIKKGSFQLEEDYCGYVIDGDYDAATGTMRVTRYDNCPNELMVRHLSTACATPGSQSQGQPQKWDDTLNDFVDDESMLPVDIVDPLCWRLALPDDRYKVERDNCSQQKYRPSFPFGLIRPIKIKDAIPCSDSASGKATVLQNAKTESGDPTCEWEESDCEIDVCNTTNRILACDTEEEKATAVFVPGDCIAFVIANHRPMFGTVTLASKSCGAVTPIQDLQWLDSCDWGENTHHQVAENHVGIYGCEGDTALVHYYEDGDECKLNIIQIAEHDLGKPMYDIKCGSETCAVEMTRLKSSMYGHQCEDCGETEDAVTQLIGQEVTVIVEVDSETDSGTATVLTGAECGTGTCQLEFSTSGAATKKITRKTQAICVFCTSSVPSESQDVVGDLMVLGEGSTPVVIEGQRVEIVTLGLDCVNCQMTVTKHTICTFCASSSEALTPIDLVTIDVPFGAFTSEEVLDQSNDPIGCNLVQETRRYCVFGCDTGSGDPIESPMTPIEPLTDVTFGLQSCILSVQPTKTAMYSIVGCISNPEGMEADLVYASDICDCCTPTTPPPTTAPPSTSAPTTLPPTTAPPTTEAPTTAPPTTEDGISACGCEDLPETLYLRDSDDDSLICTLQYTSALPNVGGNPPGWQCDDGGGTVEFYCEPGSPPTPDRWKIDDSEGGVAYSSTGYCTGTIASFTATNLGDVYVSTT